jgi:hypothetical protein
MLSHFFPTYLWFRKKAWTNWERFMDHQTEAGPNPSTTTKR